MNEKEAYQKRIQAKLDELKGHIEGLQAKGKQKEAQARQHYYDQLADVQKKMDDVRDASGDAWSRLKEGADRSMEEISSALGDAKDAVKRA